MQRLGMFAAAVLACAVTSWAPCASADSMDPAFERLRLDANNAVLPTNADCRSMAVAMMACKPDNVAFKRIVNEYGYAIAPTAMHVARTTGYGGFHLALEASFTKINDGADYWHNGTQGPPDPNTGKQSFSNKTPDSMLQVYMLKLRKGLPLGFELTANVGYMAHTSFITGGADIRWSLLEGFRTGIPGIFPDLSVGGAVRTITGTPELLLTVAGLDMQVSKPIPIADSSIITPYVGYQYLYIYGNSGLIDSSPETDPLTGGTDPATGMPRCNYTGPNIPGTPGASGAQGGTPVCSNANGSTADFNNTFVFNPVRISRHRLIAGVNYRYEMITMSAQFMPEIVDAPDANSGSVADALKGTSRQWTLAIDGGVIF